MKTPAIQQITPTDLRPHPLHDDATLRPRMAAALLATRKHREKGEEETIAWGRFLADVQAHGVREAILAVPGKDGWLVVDGRHRWLAASECRLATVPVQAMEDDAVKIRAAIMGALTLRKHVTKGAIAYQVVKLYPHLAGGKTRPGPRPKGISTKIVLITRDEAAALAGVSTTMLDDAIATYRDLAKFPERRLETEPLLLGGFISLGGARCAGPGADSTKGHLKMEPCGLGDALAGLRQLSKGAERFATWKPAMLTEMAEQARAEVALWPSGLRDILREALAPLEEGAEA